MWKPIVYDVCFFCIARPDNQYLWCSILSWLAEIEMSCNEARNKVLANANDLTASSTSVINLTCSGINVWFLVGNELTGNTNLITHYNLEHAYNKFCGKKVKEKLSNFLPELPGRFFYQQPAANESWQPVRKDKGNSNGWMDGVSNITFIISRGLNLDVCLYHHKHWNFQTPATCLSVSSSQVACNYVFITA